MIVAQDRHLKSAVGDGDDTHEQAYREVKSRWRRRKQSLGRYFATKKAFAELPER